MAIDRRKIIESYFALPKIGDKVDLKKPDMPDLWERLETWLPRWLDELSDQLSGTHKISASKEKALRRLRPLVEDALKKKFPALSVEETTNTQPTATGDKTMQTQIASHAKKTTAHKPGARASAKPAASAKPKKVGDFKTDAKIKVLVKTNPRRAGTHGHKVFEAYKRCKTVGDALEKGAKVADLRWDVDHKYISIG